MASSAPGPFFTTSTPSNHEVNNESPELKIDFEKFENGNLEQFFEIDATVEWIKSNSFTRIALQFPDSMLKFSERLSSMIDQKCDNTVKTFILADTSYRSCCIDEVAAAHSSCDALIHYGEACLSSPTKNIPVKYVLGQMPIDFDSFKSEMTSIVGELNSETIVIVVDSVYSHNQENIIEAAKSIIPKNRKLEIAHLLKLEEINNKSDNTYLGRHIPLCLKQLSPCDLIFVGPRESPFLPLWLLSFPSCYTVTHYDPMEKTITHESTRSSRLLRKRLFLIEKLKDANTVGLVVGSVGVDKHREAVKRMRELCKTAGKKIYVISVGKINVPKLSNFSSDIDVFVLLSCPFGVLLDSSEFYRPVMSMFEAEIALNSSKSWAADSGWSADFSTFLDDKISTEIIEDNGDFSLISGKVRVQHRQEEGTEDDGTPKTIALYTAGDYFADRSWKGLDDSVRVDEETTVSEGRSGIAQGYTGK